MSTPEGVDSTRGDEATSTGLGPEELDDVTADGSAGDGTLADGPLADDPLAASPPDDGSLGDDPLTDDEAAAGTPDDALTGEDSRGAEEALPDELQADALGRPLDGSMNDDDQGMENAGDNLGI